MTIMISDLRLLRFYANVKAKFALGAVIGVTASGSVASLSSGSIVDLGYLFMPLH